MIKPHNFELMEASPTGDSLSNSMTVFGLLNGMIGGPILLLPLIGISTGYVTTILICFTLGFISYFTANLIVVHLGKAKNMQECVYEHFDKNYSYVKAYSLIIWCGNIPLLIIYFKLICLQLEGLIGEHSWISIVIALALLVGIMLVVHFDIGEQTMGIGIINIVLYLIFIGWTLATAPAGDIKMEQFGSPNLLISTLLMAFSIHEIIPQNIIKNHRREDYRSIIAVTFLMGTLIYIYITEGSFGLINRISFRKNPETIEDYFEIGSIQVSIIEVIYLLNLFTIFPQFLKLSKIRFFDVLQMQNEHRIQWKQTLYIAIVLGICLFVHLMDIRIDTLIAINGGIIENLVVIVIPVIIHLKCVYYHRNCGGIEGAIEQECDTNDNSCQCEYTYPNQFIKSLELIFSILIVIFGFIVLVGSIKEQFSKI